MFSILIVYFDRGNAVVVTTGDKIRDTVILTVRMDAVDLPLQYLTSQLATASTVSGRKPEPGKKPRKGMNTAEMTAYCQNFMKYVTEPSLLLLDRASAHTAKLVHKEFDSYFLPDGRKAVTIELLAPKSAFLISPLDNGAIAEFKGYFYKFDRRTLPLKKIAAVNAWKMVSNDNLRSYIRNCGWFSDESLDSIRSRFLREVRHGIPDKFKEIRDYYDGWRSGSFKVRGICCPRNVPLEPPGQLLEGFLDGCYWTEYGTSL
jgi:hypothetical protein